MNEIEIRALCLGDVGDLLYVAPLGLVRDTVVALLIRVGRPDFRSLREID
jgi:hypothetical protein